MARATRIGVALWVLAAAALAVSLLVPDPEPAGWFSYVPLSESDDIRVTTEDRHGLLDPTLWQGIAAGLAVAGAVVTVSGRRVAPAPERRACTTAGSAGTARVESLCGL